MDILQRIKAGNCYIRTEDDHDLALVINFCLDHKIHWRCEKILGWFADEVKTILTFEIQPYTHRLALCWNPFEPTEGNYDITDQFFNEIA